MTPSGRSSVMNITHYFNSFKLRRNVETRILFFSHNHAIIATLLRFELTLQVLGGVIHDTILEACQNRNFWGKNDVTYLVGREIISQV